MPSAYCVVWDRRGAGGSKRVVVGLKNLYDKYFLYFSYYAPDLGPRQPTFSICNNAGQWVLPGGGLDDNPNTPAGAEDAALDEFWQECWINLRHFIDQGSAHVRARLQFPPAPAAAQYWGIYVEVDRIEDVLGSRILQWQPGRDLHFELQDAIIVELANSNMFGPGRRPLDYWGLRDQELSLRDKTFLPNTLAVTKSRRGVGVAARVNMMRVRRGDDGSWFDHVLHELIHM